MEIAPKHPALAAFANGAAKRLLRPPPIKTAPASPIYRECLKNHAAALGGHALDGCGEFMPSPLSSLADPTSLKCAACGCHRNFHRRDDDDDNIHSLDNNLSHDAAAAPSDEAVNAGNGGGVSSTKRRADSSSASPPPAPPAPISSACFPSAPQMLLALSTGIAGGTSLHSPAASVARKRFRTKFSREQKERMWAFAEKLGWKMRKQEEREVEEFCKEIGIARGVLKVWMHNNKNSISKREIALPMNSSSNNDSHSGIDQKNNVFPVFDRLLFSVK